MKNAIIFLCTIITFNAVAQVPHIEGTVAVSIKDGIIDCNLIVTNVPKIKDYTIWLNAGLNIQYFRDSADKNNFYYEKIYDSKTSYEAFQYTLPDTDTTITLPSSFRVKYTGKFAVVTDTTKMYNRADWKGNIAFNGKTLRASEQTAWYPIIYDKTNDIVIDKYTYNIKVESVDAVSMYLNGDNPKTGKANSFTSKMPVSLLLFAGNFTFNNSSGVNFLNSGLQPNQQQYLANYTKDIFTYYQSKLNIPYGKNISYIATTAVSKKNSWLFVTYPSVVIVGNKSFSIKDIFKNPNSLVVDTSIIQTISHEMGHYYFGTLCNPNATLRWMFLEGTTEYLSLQYTLHKFGEEAYKQAIKDYVKTVQGFGKIIPISNIKTANQIGEGYRYYYVPLLLTALEKNIGITKTWQWLKSIIIDKNALTNYEYFKNSLLKNGMSDKDFNTFEATYINNDKALDNVINTASTIK